METLIAKLDGVSILDAEKLEGLSVTGVEHHSARLKPGMVFVLTLHDSGRARQYLREALTRHPAAVVLHPSVLPYLKEIAPDVPRMVVDNPRHTLGWLLKHWYHAPDEQLQIVGVTGTNGKTSTVWFLQQLLTRIGFATFSIGTLGAGTPEHMVETGYTTPDPVILWQWLAKAVQDRIDVIAMEVSSHALDQDRLAALHFHIGVFTNLTHDHLDYHSSIEHYAAAKAQLFRRLDRDAVAIFNRDDPWTPYMRAQTSAKVVEYGRDPEVEVSIREVKFHGDGIAAHFVIGQQCYQVSLPFVAEFMVWNIAAAVAVGIEMGISPELLIRTLPMLSLPPGRLERVKLPNGAVVVIDYAHTPDALRQLLDQLRRWSDQRGGRLLCVFGCGGNRDRQKRPVMGQVAATYADKVVVTSDNPRSENPADIAEEVIRGVPLTARNKMIVELDRREAIILALTSAQAFDVVVIAGKGHEQYQIVGARSIPFSDRAVVQQWIDEQGRSAE